MTTTTHPARRLRHGERPTEPLVFEDDAANKAAEEVGLHELDRAVMAWLETKDEPNKCCRESFVDGFIAADRASRQVANKAEVEPVATIDTPNFVSLLLAWEAGIFGTGDRSKQFYALTAHIDRHVAREVAAQAGQVAVPEGVIAKLDKVSRWIDKFPIPTDGATAMMCHLRDVKEALAPSPAKESK